MKQREKQLLTINRLGDIFINLNDYILKKEESNEEISFLEHFLFQASSYSMSLIHNRIVTNSKNLMNAFLLRSLIECIAIIRMHIDNKSSGDSLELLKEFNFIGEYKIYKKYRKSLDKKQFDFEQIEKNFNEAKQKYRTKSKLRTKDFNKLIFSKLPFLLDNYSFDEIVKKYCSGYYQFYGLLSIFLHPNDQKLTYEKLRNEKLDELELLLFNDLLALIKENYKIKLLINKSLRQEILAIMPAQFNQEYMSLSVAVKKSLFKISNIIENEYGENTQSYILKELGEAIENLAIDKSFGFSEIVKCKAKPIFEMIAMWNYISNLPHTLEMEYLNKLITKHTRINLMNCNGLDSSRELDDAFKKFKNADRNITFEEFVERFKWPLGFMVNKTSISQFVYSMIDKLVDDDTMKAHLKMVYDESQLLSHANGYMIQSNTGSFMEYSSVIVSTDLLTRALLEKYILCLKIYDSLEGNGRYKKFITDLENENKILIDFQSKKNKLDYDNRNAEASH